MNYWIVESLMFDRTWFLFRENGQEIKITAVKDVINTSIMLMDCELNDFKNNHMRTPIVNLKLKK